MGRGTRDVSTRTWSELGLISGWDWACQKFAAPYIREWSLGRNALKQPEVTTAAKIGPTSVRLRTSDRLRAGLRSDFGPDIGPTSDFGPDFGPTSDRLRSDFGPDC